jgi:hypothetical protein
MPQTCNLPSSPAGSAEFRADSATSERVIAPGNSEGLSHTRILTRNPIWANILKDLAGKPVGGSSPLARTGRRENPMFAISG